MVPLFLLVSLFASGLGFPNAATQNGGFTPLTNARGVPQGEIFSSTKTKKSISGEEQISAASGPSPVYGAGFGGGSAFGGHGYGLEDQGPTKTIYVNVPPEQYPPPKPIAAGPPRKHYRIVFIRSPAPPPPQPIIPPRVEQKTLIYVLHPRQQAGHNIVEVPDVKHDPQVYFIQYDDEPPTAEDLQDLVKNTIDSHAAGFEYGGPGVAGNLGGIFPSAAAPTYQDSIGAGNEISVLKQKKSVGPRQPVKKSVSPQVIRARPDAREVVKPSAPLRHSQNEKFVQTRQVSHEASAKIKEAVAPARTNLRVNGLQNKRQNTGAPTHRFTRNPTDPAADNLKAAFRSPFTKPFRFGAKKPAKKQETAETSVNKESS